MKKKLVFYSFCLIVLIVCFNVGYFISLNKSTKGSLKSKDAKKSEESLTQSVNFDLQKQKLSPNAEVCYKQVYLVCGHNITSENTIDPKWVNMTREDLEKAVLGWKVIEFRRDYVLLEKNFSDLCLNHYIIKENGNEIVVSQKKLNGDTDILKRIELPLGHLSTEDINRLKAGIEIDSREELNQLLEDFTS